MSKLKILQPVEEKQEFLEIDETASNDGDDEQKHEKLLNAISKLGKNKKMSITQRTEPISKINEHALVQIATGEENAKVKKIRVDDLLRVIAEKPRLGALAKNVKLAKSRTTTLKVPLEKPQALRVERAAGYEKVKEEISRWDDIVKGNRNAEQLIFPLNQPSVKVHTSKEFTAKFKPKTPLEQQISELLRGNKNVQVEDQELTPAEQEALTSMSLKEALERRKELAKIRALQSYQEAKARRQNKIKSKTYHRLLKREKMKNHVKEFETLKEHNPEKALEQLEQLDKKRIEERMTLKHKGAGKWAKLQAIRSKYDENARESLADQLRIGKEVTRKVKKSDDESDEDIPPIPLEKSDNPWLGGSESSRPIAEITSGYRKLWDTVNKGKEIKKNEKESPAYANSEQNKNLNESTMTAVNKQKKNIKEKTTTAISKQKKNMKEGTTTAINKQKKNTNGKANRKQRTKQQSVENGDKGGDLSAYDFDNKSITSEPPEMQEEFSEELSEGLVRKSTLEDFEHRDEDFEVKQIRRPKEAIEEEEDSKITENETELITDIDPFKFISMSGATIIDSSIPVTEEGNEEDEDEEQQRRMTLMEAFADDDVIEQFKEEKKQVVNASTPKDIDLTLPGWGEWGGSGMDISKRKKRKFIIKAPPAPKRRDGNKEHLIINQDKNTIMRRQQVNDLPFPFRSTAAFESTIRAPVTSTFIPETAVRKLTAPKVITKIGTVIAPMTDEVLVSTTNRKKESDDKMEIEDAKKSSKVKDKRKRSELTSIPPKKRKVQKNEWKITDKPAPKSLKP